MDIAFDCPNCEIKIEVNATCAGSQMECPGCHATINIPETALCDEEMKQGNPPTQSHAEGETMSESEEIDIAQIEAAAEQGDAAAQNQLGLIYSEGRAGVAVDNLRAVEWFRRAAAQGMCVAQWNLGLHYKNGEGVPKNQSEAIRLFRQVAEQGVASVQRYLGFLQDNEGNYSEAAHWYLRSAAQGDPVAQNNLAVLYHEGKGVPINYVEAYKWYSLAAAQNEENSIRWLPEVAKEMTREQIAEAQRRAAGFARRDERAERDKATDSSGPHGFQDVTSLVERLEVFEERLDVRIDALKATFFISTENVPWLRVCGEVHPRNGVQIKHHIRIIVDIYDSSGGLLNNGFHWLSEPVEFFGFETFTVAVNVEKFGKLRVYPRRT